MKARLVELVRAAPTPAHGRSVAREYLQARILGAMQRAGAMIPLAFHGGTALRFLYVGCTMPLHIRDVIHIPPHQTLSGGEGGRDQRRRTQGISRSGVRGHQCPIR